MLGLALITAGVLLVVVAGGYYVYGLIATQSLDSLKYGPDVASPSPLAVSGMTLRGLLGQASSTSSGATGDGITDAPNPEDSRLYPGEWLAFDSWDEPFGAEPPSMLDEEFAREFLPVDPATLKEMGTLPPATRISIPAIELEAEITELQILDLGDSRQYETPNRVVGHIPGTASPGEFGNGWLFGHLQSPLKDEGSIFIDLPKIPDILRTGWPVHIVLESPAGSYLYEVYETDFLHKDDFRLYDRDDSSITLVTCVPLWTYSHRLLVTAKLVGFKPGA